MANILTHAARHAKAELLSAGIEVGHAKLQEVMAALLGYHTYRALKLEEDDQELEQHLSDAEFIVLDQELGKCRAAELFELPGEVLPKCIAALEECLPAQVLPSVVELQKTNVLLTHEKAGSSGLVLRGVKPVEDITAVLEVTRVDQLVRSDDGSAVRPWVAVVVHTPSRTVLGSAISLADDLGLLEVNALADALRSTLHVATDESRDYLPYRISKLQIYGSVRSNGLIRMAMIAGVDVTRRTRPMAGGSAERILQKVTTLGMRMRQLRYSRKSKPNVMTLAAFTKHFQKNCKILRRLKSNHHAGHNIGHVLIEPE
ncbi:hypothetical protein [Pseudomonas fulva]|uniref:hypothetical protein n=1 Tax=Pseudomonas fulva TaxID=47880 RepID=UPI002B1D3E3B|nr:hypothetical protein [Pseudomonas fulva]